MPNNFTLEMYAADPNFETPNGGSTLISLSGQSTVPGYSATYFQVDDTQELEFGSQPPEIRSLNLVGQHGSKGTSYVRKDRVIKFSLIVTSDTVANMKAAVYALQSCINDAVDYGVSADNNNSIGPKLGRPIFLKYQPDPTASAVYFPIKNGWLDTKNFNEQVKLLNIQCELPVELTTGHVSYGQAQLLENYCVNGTFSMAFNKWTINGNGSDPYTTSSTTLRSGWQSLFTFNPAKPLPYNFTQGTTPSNFSGIAGAYLQASSFNQTTFPDAWWSIADTTSGVFSAALWGGFGTSGTETMYSWDVPVTINNTTDFWLKFDFMDSLSSGGTGATVSLQFTNTTDGAGWVDYNPSTESAFIITPTNTNKVWTSFSAHITARPAAMGSNLPVAVRVKVTADKSKATSYWFAIRKIGVWFTGLNDSAYAGTLPPSEYVVQGASQTDSCVVIGIKGTTETSAKISLLDPPAIWLSQTPSGYQYAQMGIRRQTGIPYSNYFSVNGTGLTIGVGVNSVVATGYGLTAFCDYSPRQYQLLMRISTTAAVGLAFGSSTVVPNEAVSSIPNTGGSYQLVYCGIYTPFRGHYHETFAGNTTAALTLIPTFNRLTESGTASITVNLSDVWLLPADQAHWADTKSTNWVPTQDTLPTYPSTLTNSAYLNGKQLVFDSLLKEDLILFLSNPGNVNASSNPAFVAISPISDAKPVRLYPATATSPEPNLISTVILRPGSNGNPATDIVIADRVHYSITYCPAYEF